ncbi:MAG: hypothetical protein PHQ54_03150 [Candidatus Omnitrophica bacterium]|nr:hypothetical protein [Candidatus Omnitrophota bacterium]
MAKNQQNLDFEREFVSKLIEQNPDYTDGLILLADLLTKNKEYQKALEIDSRLSVLKPEDPFVFYNLACDYSLLNKKTLSLKALEKSLKLGYDDFQHLLNDPDLQNLRESRRFQGLIEKYISNYQKIN